MAEMTPPEPPEEPVGEALPPPEPPKAPTEAVQPTLPAASPEAIIGGGCAGLIVASLLGLANLGYVLGGMGLDGGSTPKSGCGTSTIVAGIVETAIVVGLSVLAWWLLFKVRRTGKNTDFFRAMAVVAAVFFLIPWPCGASLPAYSAFSSCHR